MRSFFAVFPKVALYMSICLFCLSLLGETFYLKTSIPRAGFPGWQLLLFGWSALPHGGLSWLANPAMCAAWLLLALDHPARSAGLAALGLALMLSFLLVSEVASMYGEGVMSPAAYGTGYALWIASAIVLLLGTFIAAMPTEFLNERANKGGEP